VRIDTLMASVQGSTVPTVWLRVWSESPNDGAGYAVDLRVPLTATGSDFYAFGGVLTPGLLLQGGSEFNAHGVPARGTYCVKAPASASATVRFIAAGVYHD
jgi:hypothetical protein